MASKEVLDAAVAQGHAKYVDAKVTVEIPGKSEKVTRPFQKYVALDIEGALAYCDGKEKPEFEEDGSEKRGVNSVIGFFNYASDLYQRQPVRTQVLAENEGPAKTIEKGVKGLMAALGLSEEDARTMIVEQRKAKGLPVE